ncbi:MAG: zinc ABC transporter ATP-binding protein AztA [Hydrogenophaga sp.]|uniref:zinc ABC transporter ATP-binding protein AztA n=1 Tax=Hydrogenophaga sp. TaxID=1904254 RepID=UPI003D9B8241
MPHAPADPSASSAPAIGLHDLTLGYDRHPAVHHLNADIAPGSLLALVGPNGAGKSTLVKALAGELRPISGTVSGLAGRRIAWLPQHSALDPSFPIDVRRMVAMGLWHRVGALGRFTTEHRRLCDEALAAVGLTGFETRGLDTLSGVQLQRALFARLILQDAPVVLLDEPFAAVDHRTSTDLLALLHHWQRQGKTVIVVLHDLAQVRAHFPLTLLLARERVAFGPTAEVLTDAHWARAQRLHEPFDDDAPTCEAPQGPHTHAHHHGHGAEALA